MRIVIDLQGAQTAGSASRGIGRYTMALARGIARLRGQHEVIVAASDAFPDSIPSLRAAFASVLPAENFRVWQCPRGISAADDANHGRKAAAELVREAYLAALQPDIVLISSLFEGIVDDAIASVGALHDIPTAVVLYDLIPYIHRQTYLTPNPVVEAWYEAQLNHLRRADLLLAISGSSRQEAEDHLGFAPEQVANIGAAADPQFRRQNFTQSALDAVRARYGLTRPFVMYTGGIDHRKNLDRLVSAFARLPALLRQEHQLAIVCKADDAARERLKAWAKQEGLGDTDLVLTGFVPEDDLIALYHACAVFVFPSWHEGFGLPALEAMACGAPVIASDTSSLPEVIGWHDALFDPMKPDAIAAKLQQVLTDPAFRERLITHGQQQATRFTWDITARRALEALEQLHKRRAPSAVTVRQRAPRPRLAYISPLPPEKSGISDYSAELLPELARFYDIELIVDQANVEPAWMSRQFPVRSPDWLRANPAYYERVLFHFGNSAFHHHMFDLLHEVPGVAVLHDFFLSGVAWWMEHAAKRPGQLASALYQSHGYAAVAQRFERPDVSSAIWEFPCNARVIEDAIGIIAHGPNARRLAEQWYGPGNGRDWSVIPLLRRPAVQIDRQQARERVGVPEGAMVVCSFGLLGPTKLNHLLLEAWLASAHACNPNAYLIFVGENDGGDYGRGLAATIESSEAPQRIRITGWADTAAYRDYLAAADIAVQLRTKSRGETSAAVLDCMNYGLATVVNAHGSMADLAQDTVWKLPDSFEPKELVLALETLARDTAQRAALGQHARHRILTRHAPRVCAEQYYQAIETAYRKATVAIRGAIGAIGRMKLPLANADLAQIAACLAQNQTRRTARQLLVDVSELVVLDVKSGIQQAVHGILWEFLQAAPAGYRVEPVYAAANEEGYRYARRWTLNFIGAAADRFADDIIEVHQGDIFLALDLNHKVPVTQAALYRRWRNFGVHTYFVVSNLLPVRTPQRFVPGAAALHTAWLDVVAEADGVLCVSRAVAEDFRVWLQEREVRRSTPMHIGWFPLGGDVENTAPARGIPQATPGVAKVTSWKESAQKLLECMGLVARARDSDTLRLVPSEPETHSTPLHADSAIIGAN
jgi:glycosyltransferase involved in cell wall biosynthesis